MRKIKLVSIVIVGLLAVTQLFNIPKAEAKYMNSSKWKDVCPDAGIVYCGHIGKQAYNSAASGAMPIMRNVAIGEIVGVRWIKKGSNIRVSEAIPKANIPKEVKKAKESGYFYLVDDGSEENPIVMEVSQYDAR